MNQKLRMKNDIKVSRDLVYAAMQELDDEGLNRRKTIMKKNPENGNFTSKGIDWTHSLAGNCKLMGYQRSTFPLSVYGCIDTASRKVISLRIFTNNCDPKRVARWYFDYLFEKRIVLAKIRIDKDSETGVTATMHTILRSGHGKLEDPSKSVVTGKSPANQIERWWRELHDCFEKYFKEQLMHILWQGHYHPQKEIYRSIIAFVYIPALEREMHLFVTTIKSDS